jgi:lysophospholipase L1-like esterase
MAGHAVRFEAHGVGADTTWQVLERLDRDVLGDNPKPDVCIVIVGTNDLPAGHPAQAITANLSQIYDKLLAAGIQPLAVPIYPFGGYHLWTPEFEGVRQQVRTWMHRWLPIHLPEVEVIDLEDVLGDLSDPSKPRMRAEYADEWGLHTNAAGAEAVARALLQRSRALSGIQG